MSQNTFLCPEPITSCSNESSKIKGLPSSQNDQLEFGAPTRIFQLADLGTARGTCTRSLPSML